MKRVFKQGLLENRLLPENGLEKRTKDEVQGALENATWQCPEDRRYKKGKRSFQVLEELDPTPLKANLPHFLRLIEMLDRNL